MGWNAAASKILLADDDSDLMAAVGFALRETGFDIVQASAGSDALTHIEQHVFSLLVLNITLPEIKGMHLCTHVRRVSNVPILMLSTPEHERVLLEALNAGADGYMIKPFGPRALIARIHALLRRASSSESRLLQAGAYRLDVEAHVLQRETVEIRLTKLENRLLHLLMSNAGSTVTTKILLTEVWATYNSANRNMLKQIVFRLRRKLAQVPGGMGLLQTTPEGYLWTGAEQDDEPATHLEAQEPRETVSLVRL